MAGTKELFGDLTNLMSVKKGGTPALFVKELKDVRAIIQDAYSCGTQQEIEDAIESIGTGSGSIFIESGTITVTGGGITIDGGGSYTIVGFGDSTILEPDPDATAISDASCIFYVSNATSVTFANFKMQNLEFAIKPDATHPHGGYPGGIVIEEASGNKVSIEDLTCTSGLTTGLGTAINCVTGNVRINDCDFSDLVRVIWADGVDNIIVSNCTFDTFDDGVYSEGGTRFSIYGNRFIDSTHTVIGFDGGERIKIYANSIENCNDGIMTSGTPSKIYVFHNSINGEITGDAIRIDGGDGYEVIGNTINFTSGNGNGISGSNGSMGIISNNTIYNAYDTGISAVDTEDLIIESNIVVDARHGLTMGITAAGGTTTRVIIEGNIVEGYTNPISGGDQVSGNLT